MPLLFKNIFSEALLGDRTAQQAGPRTGGRGGGDGDGGAGDGGNGAGESFDHLGDALFAQSRM